jgi:hypothetical protein
MSMRVALAGLLAAAVAAIFPAASAALITPRLALNQGAGTTAGSSPAIGFDVNFTPLSGIGGGALGELGGDSVRNLTISLPDGFLVNLAADGGACVVASTPVPSCQIGSGVSNGPGGKAVSMYLVAAPKPSDIAGVEMIIEGGSTTVGELALGTSPEIGLDLSFSNLAPGMTELQFTLNSPRLPTTCTPKSVTVGAQSWQGSSGIATAPLTVTGCGSLPYSPTVAATVTKEAVNSGAVLVTTFSQRVGESATSALEFAIPSGLKINRVLQPCFQQKPCTVGTVSAQSPLLPSPALSSGTLTLGSMPGSPASSEQSELSAPLMGVVLTMSFPPPYSFSLTAPVEFAEHTIKFSAMPDIPLTALSFTFTGPSSGPAFATSCQPGTIAATLTPQDGNPVSKLTGAVTNIGCPPPRPPRIGKPSAAGSLTGLASGRPTLRLRATHGANAPNIASLSIELPTGLRFNAAALRTHRVCGATSCATRQSVKGLSLAGSAIQSAQIRGGKLFIAFTRAAPNVWLAARGPLLAARRPLRVTARQQRAQALVARLRITDAGGSGTVVSVR